MGIIMIIIIIILNSPCTLVYFHYSLIMALQYEDSYDIESELSEDDCRQDNNNNNNIMLNESMTMCLNEDEQDKNEDNIDNNSPNKKAISIRSESIAIDNINHNHNTRPMRSQTIEIHSDNKGYYNYDNNTLGRCYRQCCFSSFGIKITIILNIIMILLNSGLIIYEIILIIKDESLMHTKLPLWYMVCDFIITIILFIEMLFIFGAIYKYNICSYFKSGWECWIDIVVLILSIGCCAAYYFDFTTADVDNLTMLFVRVIRDIIRIVRCLWFFKMLYSNLIRLGIHKHSKGTEIFHGEPLLANKAWKSKYKLQINSSPKSTTSDQREYKGPKRVDIYDEDDIQNLINNQDEKLKHRKMYSLTPSPPNSKKTTPHQSNIKKKNSNSQSHNKNRSRIISSPSRGSHQRNKTRNCDEFREDLVNQINVNMNGISDDHHHHHHHRQTTESINSYGDRDRDRDGDTTSGLSYLTTGTNDNYYDNLRLRQIKKKSVDKQRLRDILRNLPSGSFDKQSFSIPDSDDDDEDEDDDDMPMVANITLHGDNDKLQII